MATAYLRAESAPVILPHNFAQAAAVMAAFDRATLASTIELLVNLLDLFDGDTDLEGEWSEDEMSTVPAWVSLDAGPGCPIADAGGQCDEDEISTALHVTLRSDPGCALSDPGIADHGGLHEAHGGDDPKLTWAIDQTAPFIRSGVPS